MRPLFLSLVLLALASTLFAANPIPGVGPTGEVKRLSTGHVFTEGPAWDGRGKLYFTDIPKTQILILGEDGAVTTFTDKSNHTNGLMFTPKGELLACEMDGQLVVWDVESKKRRVLVAKFGTKRFNAPNDLVIDSTGGVYFTDPMFRAPKPLPQGQQGVYYLPAGKSEAVSIAKDLPAPNGILLSPNEKTLYVLPSRSGAMRAYEVKSPGKVSAGREFCKIEGRGGSDGAAMDVAGNLYLTTASGVQVFNPKGKHLGTIALPEHPSNCTFGGTQNKTLYVTARSSLYAVPMEIAGHRYGGKVTQAE